VCNRKKRGEIEDCVVVKWTELLLLQLMVLAKMELEMGR
jgi:hypothetical protein